MVIKRPKTSIAPQEDAKDDLEAPKSTHQEPSGGPRRSSRKLQQNGNAIALARVPDPKSARTPAQRNRLQQKQKMAKVGVDRAMSGLQEMEDSLRDAVKRQKLAISESSVIRAEDRDSEIQHAFDPRSTKASADTLQSNGKAKARTGWISDPDDFHHVDQNGHKPTPSGPETGDGNKGPDDADLNAVKREGGRPPPVNSDYLPLPWKGRLGYACLNTYLRCSNPSVFSSRTCRIASILEHRHPLQDPTQPEHPSKNRPDKSKPPDIALGQQYVQSLGLANARDIVKMVRWNDKFGIKFLRLSSEMFPFASHEEYGYKLAPFASEVLAEAGRVAGELGHRLTTHPGQFTQLGSPRKEVVSNAIRDLEYHDEMLSLLRLPKQQNKDAVMILHMGGVFGDKMATLDRFRANYTLLPPSIKARLVLENDDVSWTVHDLLPICEELNIPLVLDFHHHNIMFDESKLREGTKDIMELYPRIKATWTRKGITQKMHYSEPCAGAVTPRDRRKHSPRVLTLPPCADDMDLMIEAKDKEQAVFELMRTFKLPGWDKFNNIIPYERDDDNRPQPKAPKKAPNKAKRKKSTSDEDEADVADPNGRPEVPQSEIGMGGPNNRVYWPTGMEEWLRPKKRDVQKKPKKGPNDNDDDE